MIIVKKQKKNKTERMTKEMDKKQLGVVIALGVILLGIIIAVFVYDAKLNTSILEVNGIKYDVSDFESYLKVWQYENGEEPIDIDSMFSTYKLYKLYSQYAEKYHVKLSSENEVKALTDSEITKLAEDYALTESEYMRVKEEMALVDELYANLQDYYIISDEEYNEHKEGNEDKFKMYDYRVMQIAVEEAEETSGDTLSGDTISGDVNSGDMSGDISGDTASDNGEQARKDVAMSKAVEALAKVKSGDSFEEVAKEYGTYRFVYTPSGYNVVNGTLETVSGLYMEQYVWDTNIIEALTTLQKGEYSQIYEGDSAYTFVYLEDVREGLDETNDNLYKREIGNEHIQGEAVVVDGNRFILKSIRLEKLIPILAKEKEESGDTSGDISNVSGEQNQMSSGEVVSGEIMVSGENQ